MHLFCRCEENEWKCSTSKQCLSETLVCDGIVNCDDGSDELDCLYSSPNPTSAIYEECDHSCDSDVCIKSDHLCDGVSDCLDNSDEDGCDKDNGCDVDNGGCEHICSVRQNTKLCSCYPGFDLSGPSKCIGKIM